MSRFLFAATPFTGHVNPGLPLAAELVARGHEVRWWSTPRFRRAIEATGAKYVPFRHALPLDEESLGAMFPDRPADGIAQIRYDISRIFIDFIPGAAADLEDELDRHPADVIVGDNTSSACGIVRERRGTPWAMYGVIPLAMPSEDTAPFGLALMPGTSALSRLRNRALYWLVDHVIFAEANARYTAVRRAFGLQPTGRSIFDFPRHCDLFLQSSVPSFEYPRRDLPPQVRFVGAAIPQLPTGWKRPSWWGEMEGRKVVLVTQGTINGELDQLIRPAIRALAADENVFVVVTTGSRPAEDVAIDPLPPNVRVERFVPYAELMPHVDLLLTNGGYGSIQIALAHGVPVVAIGKTEDKPEIANRVQWSGVGIGMKVRVPSETRIRKAVTEVLSRSSYRERASELAREMAGLDAGPVDLLEQLAGVNALARSA